MSFAEDMAKKFAEGERRRAREDAEAVLAYYEMTEEEREEHDRKCMKALLETMNDGMSTTEREEPKRAVGHHKRFGVSMLECSCGGTGVAYLDIYQNFCGVCHKCKGKLNVRKSELTILKFPVYVVNENAPE